MWSSILAILKEICKTERVWYISAMVPGFSLRQLSYFVAVADRGSMAAAAEAEHVSQAAISMGIQDLERRLDLSLLVRRPGHGVTLTEAGTAVLKDARRILGASTDLLSSARSPSAELHGTLNLGCFTTLCPTILPALLGTFANDHPAVDLSVTEGSQVELRRALHSGTCELIVTYDLDLGPGIRTETIQHMRPLALLPGGHPLAEQATVRLFDLADVPLIEYALQPRSSGQFVREQGFASEVGHRSTNIDVVRCLVARGLGWAIVLQQWPTDLSLEGRPLVAVPLSDDVPGADVVAAWPDQDQLSRRATAVVTFLRRLAGGRSGLDRALTGS
jgi:DNA-binding transcriptional LysR family regulator